MTFVKHAIITKKIKFVSAPVFGMSWMTRQKSKDRSKYKLDIL